MLTVQAVSGTRTQTARRLALFAVLVIAVVAVGTGRQAAPPRLVVAEAIATSHAARNRVANIAARKAGFARVLLLEVALGAFLDACTAVSQQEEPIVADVTAITPGAVLAVIGTSDALPPWEQAVSWVANLAFA